MDKVSRVLDLRESPAHVALADKTGNGLNAVSVTRQDAHVRVGVPSKDTIVKIHGPIHVPAGNLIKGEVTCLFGQRLGEAPVLD